MGDRGADMAGQSRHARGCDKDRRAVSPRAIEDASLRLAMTYHASVPQNTDMPTMSHAVCQTACQAASHAACHVAALHFVFVIAFGTFELKCLH